MKINIAIKKRPDNQEVRALATLSISAPYAPIMLIAISPLVGSFLALLADRLPRGEDTIVKRSYCRDCETALGSSDLIPLFSFIFSGGKCRHCKSKIPWHLPFTEFGAVLIALFAVWNVTPDILMVLNAVFMWIMLALFITDARFFRLPNILTAGAFLIAIAIIYFDPNRDLIAHLITGAIASATFWGIRYGYQKLRGVQGLGLGDVKLIASIGIASGPLGLPTVVLIAALLAIAYAVVRAIATGQPINGKIALPFGSFLCLAITIFWVIVGF
jgi:leader peptidase (prepilin peptidase)/N-methyltransferase